MIEGLFVESFELELMASGFVGPTVGRLTCRVGKELVCCTEVLSAAPQVGFVVGFRALCLEVDNIRRYFGWKPGL